VPGAGELDPVLHQQVRLRLMVLLFRNREASAAWLRATLDLTDGNLGSHAGKLVAAGYVRQRPALTPTGFELRYAITPQGDAAFQAYLAALRGLLGDGAPSPLAQG